MTFMMPGFIARLTRPFTTATSLGISAENGAGAAAIPEGAHKATVAAGCFWGVEHIYRKHFADKGLYDARVGYIGGDTKSPSYRAVCSGSTGHAEATQIVYDPTRITYRELLEFFYRIHDPTTRNRQGNDAGTQYRSGIFFHDAEQERVAREVTAAANEQWYGGKIATEVIAAGQWWDAEDYHQLYLDKNPFGYQCPTHFLRDQPPLK
ncbi:Peptide methionine sulfoxide reductase [Diaporthe australafricana]|uniref:peptide-methionine (S)-S-oxide reductase n=1 Tax=Diaporthe australafricana TaxID=127596 RepID=A0ABR3XT95_9PEZI